MLRFGSNRGAQMKRACCDLDRTRGLRWSKHAAIWIEQGGSDGANMLRFGSNRGAHMERRGIGIRQPC
eukprot:1001053-Prorocentrum_minimum.AAC.1